MTRLISAVILLITASVWQLHLVEGSTTAALLLGAKGLALAKYGLPLKYLAGKKLAIGGAATLVGLGLTKKFASSKHHFGGFEPYVEPIHIYPPDYHHYSTPYYGGGGHGPVRSYSSPYGSGYGYGHGGPNFAVGPYGSAYEFGGGGYHSNPHVGYGEPFNYGDYHGPGPIYSSSASSAYGSYGSGYSEGYYPFK